MDGPHFFLDRSLGRNQVPQLLRADGWSLTTLSEHYGVPADEGVEDVEWLSMAGAAGWPVLMKDEKIRYRTAERAAILNAGVRAFCLTNGNLLAAEMADRFIRHKRAIWAAARATDPMIYAVTASGMRPLGID